MVQVNDKIYEEALKIGLAPTANPVGSYLQVLEICNRIRTFLEMGFKEGYKQAQADIIINKANTEDAGN